MRPPWAVLSALLVGLHAAFVHGLVPAPENVTVQCSDHRPQVSWDYSSQKPTNFTVQLLGGNGFPPLQTENHTFDLGDLLWTTEYEMFNFLYVEITAVQGSNRSKPSPSPSFSYKLHKTVHVTCNLAFPPVNLTVDGTEATVSLENPLHFYKELKNMQHSSDFYLRITVKNRPDQEKHCDRGIRRCKFSVDLPEDSDPCVNLTGWIKRELESIRVLRPRPVCADATSGEDWVVAILCLVIFVFVIVAVAIAICKTRAWIFPKIPTPNTLMVSNPQKKRLSIPLSETVYSSVQIIGSRPEPFLQDPESHFPKFEEVQPEDWALIPQEDLHEDQDESDESIETETYSIHSSSSEEIVVPNYERRPMFVDLGDNDDQVIGYLS